MSPVDTQSSMSRMTNASSNLESPAASTVEQTDNGEVRPDTEFQETAEYGRGKLLELAAWKDEDPTHILFRRHVENGSLCVDLEANYLERDATVYRKKIESDDEDLEEYHERFMVRLNRFYQFGYQFSKIMELDEPSGVFLNNSLFLARQKWGEEKGTHLKAKNEDWASLYKTDKPDQWIRYLLHHPLSLRIMRDMNLVSHEGDITITFISERYASTSCYIDTQHDDTDGHNCNIPIVCVGRRVSYSMVRSGVHQATLGLPSVCERNGSSHEAERLTSR
ncbi:hypothetical protein FSHL1_002259 [Fusarium sambucinum]